MRVRIRDLSARGRGARLRLGIGPLAGACLLIGGAMLPAMAGSGKDLRDSLPAPVTDADFYDNGNPNPIKVELGRLLFHDKILSGNMNISCATCHHPLTDTGDGLSLPVGEGGVGLGMTRNNGSGLSAVHERVPRNAPHIFNLGAKEFERMFDDGRVEVDPSEPSGFRNPAGSALPIGLENVLAAQAMFPVTSATEMAGQAGENPIADEAALGNLAGPGGVWEQLAVRLRGIPAYVDLFKAAFPAIKEPADVTYRDAANAIAAFEAKAWRADNSPFDRWLRGEKNLLNNHEKAGMKLFYGKAGCASCHSGPFQTDQQFHAICMPQIGPGKGDGVDGHEDFGRIRVTGAAADMLAFRTPTLRNVMLTGPWGHDGAFNSLAAMLDHHLDPVTSLNNYDQSQAVLPYRADLAALDFIVMNDPARLATIEAANELAPVSLTPQEKQYLLEFLEALTDPASIDLRRDVPMTVPSGLPVAE